MAITVNKKGKSHAMALVNSGKVDKNGSWSFSAEDGNKLLGDKGDDWAEYGKWFLAEDASAAENTKERFKYPFGKDGKAFRAGIIAAKQRAAAQGETDIEAAADAVLQKIDKEDKTALAELKDIEIFQGGTYRGKTYDDSKLDEIVKNTNEFLSEIKPVAVIGHDEDQDLLKQSGLFSAGWMTPVKKVGSKIVASFKDVPQVLADIINKGGFKRISSEIYHDYNGKGLAIRRVAILGGDIPEVKTLQDIAALYAEGPAKETTWVGFGETDQKGKENTMNKCASCGKDMGDAKFCPHCGAKASSQATMAEELTALRSENTKLKGEKDQAVTKLSEEQTRVKKTEIHTFCETSKAAGQVNPAMQDMGLEQFMESLDSGKVMKFGEGDKAKDFSQLDWFKNFVAKFGKVIHFGEMAKTGEGNLTKLAEVDEGAKAIAAASPKPAAKK